MIGRRLADRVARVVRHLAHRATAPFLMPARISDHVTIRIDESPATTPRASFVPCWPFGTLTFDEWRAMSKEDQDALLADDAGTDVDDVMADCSARERAWMQTVSGRKFYPLDPQLEDIDIYDIAHGLAMCCRYAGHAHRFYSVAEHCVHVSRLIERDMRDADGWYRRTRGVSEREVLEWSLAALLHDSSEAYLGDMIRPLKHQPEMAEFRTAEARLEDVVRRRFSLTADPAAWLAIKRIDERIIVDEIGTLKRDVEMYRTLGAITAEPLGVRLECWSPDSAREHFLHRFDGLTRALAAQE